MIKKILNINILFFMVCGFVNAESDQLVPPPLEIQRALLLEKMQNELGTTPEQSQKMQSIFSSSRAIGQGLPSVTRYAMTRAQCFENRKAAKDKDTVDYALAESICGHKNMVPLYKDGTRALKDVPLSEIEACIDQYEFPNLECEYPVTYVTAREAALLCEAQGKRLCDAHEWEGGCAGSLNEPDYGWTGPHKDGPIGHGTSRSQHNSKRDVTFSYGKVEGSVACATTSRKSPSCNASEFGKCGSNTFPTGAFPECKSVFGAYDFHGNAAEHMNLPLRQSESSREGTALGSTEMKGQWFIGNGAKVGGQLFDCRWRAPYWHGTKVKANNSHSNYHLGFRCCSNPIKK